MFLKTIMLIVGVLASQNLGAQGITRLAKEQKKAAPQPKVRDEEILQKILKNNRKIDALLQARMGDPVIWEKRARIHSGKTFRGIVLNSIFSTNLASPIVVEAAPGQGLEAKTRFLCTGVTQHKRVQTQCHRMVTSERELSIQAVVLNSDGSSGLIGEYDDAKDALIGGAILSDFSQGMLSAAQSRISGPLGAITDSSVKNQLLQGAIQSGHTTSEILLEEMRQKEPVVMIEQGSEVLIYFLEGTHAI